MRVLEAVARGAAGLPERPGILDPRREARWLLGAAWGVSESWLRARPETELPFEVEARYLSWIERRAAGEPAEHLIGACEFWGRRLIVTPSVLVPRPETELLVEGVLSLELPVNARVMDVGTGSGAIALSLAAERPRWRVAAVDRSLAALAVARANCRSHGVALSLWMGDLLTAAGGPWHVVTANLPYIPSANVPELPLEVQHDPRIALDGGADGLDLVRRLLGQLGCQLAPQAVVALELGEEQADAVSELAHAQGLSELRRIRDLGGCDRILFVQRSR